MIKILFRKAAVNLLLFLGGALFGLLLVEGLCYLLNSAAPSENPAAKTAASPAFFQYHPVVGWAGIPHASAKLPYGSIAHDAKGQRRVDGPVEDTVEDAGEETKGDTAEDTPEQSGKRTSIAPLRRRILILGDSQVWGFHADNARTVPSLLQGMLNKPEHRAGYRVENIAAQGYGPDQCYLALILWGVAKRPEHVLYVFYAANDVWDAAADRAILARAGVAKPFFVEKEDGRLCLSGVPVEPAPGWPNQYLSLLVLQWAGKAAPRALLFGTELDFGSLQLWRFLEQHRVSAGLQAGFSLPWRKVLYPGFDIAAELQALDAGVACRGDFELPTRTRQEKLALFLRLVRQLEQTAAAAGASFTVAMSPIRTPYRTGSSRSVYHQAKKLLTAHSIAVLDIEERARQEGITENELFLPGWDSHLTEMGNELIARAYAEHLQGMGK